MNISGSSLPSVSGAGEGAQVYSAALAKKQQIIEGQAALALIESAAQVSSSSASTHSASSPTLGQHINIHV